MPTLIVTSRDGNSHNVVVDAGLSVMEVIRNAGFDDLLALCGGCCSCATCHVHVDEGWLGRLPPMTSDEDELLNSSGDRNGTSRLACQVIFTDDLDGLPVRIAEAG